MEWVQVYDRIEKCTPVTFNNTALVHQPNKILNEIGLTYLIFNYNLSDSFLILLSFFGVDCIDFLQSADHQVMRIHLPFQDHLDK